MFLLYLLGCQTSIQFDFLSVLFLFFFLIVVVLLLVVRGGTVYLPIPPSWPVVCFNFFQYFIYLLLDRGERREKEREREKRHCVVASCLHMTGTRSSSQACALTGNPTYLDLLLCRVMLNQPSQMSQGKMAPFFKSISLGLPAKMEA